MTDILMQLKQWQRGQAVREGVEAYRVLPYRTLEELAQAVPQTEEELLDIKGIGPAKVRRYGKVLLTMLKEQYAQPNLLINSGIDTNNAILDKGDNFAQNDETGEVVSSSDDVPLSVSVFLDAINVQLGANTVRVRGEVVSVNVYPRAVYFSIKDVSGDSVLSCVIFRYQYDVAGVVLEAGMDVIVSGSPEVYKPNGRFNLKATMVELAGAGALKKAYDALKKKLETEGLLDALRKRQVPALPTRIGLITSRDSAAIGDFRSNLGKYGLQVRLVHASVEGARAVPELLRALDILAQVDIDVLVITRGGGSMESLQAFNNEAILRKLVGFKVPVIAGIGHERDETLATLVADIGVSTPTAAARDITASWDNAQETLLRSQQALMQFASKIINNAHNQLERAPRVLMVFMTNIRTQFDSVYMRIVRANTKYAGILTATKVQLVQTQTRLRDQFAQVVTQAVGRLVQHKALLTAHNPERLLERGYAIVRTVNGRVVRHVRDTSIGDALAVSVSNGIIQTTVVAQNIEKGESKAKKQ